MKEVLTLILAFLFFHFANAQKTSKILSDSLYKVGLKAYKDSNYLEAYQFLSKYRDLNKQKFYSNKKQNVTSKINKIIEYCIYKINLTKTEFDKQFYYKTEDVKFQNIKKISDTIYTIPRPFKQKVN